MPVEGQPDPSTTTNTQAGAGTVEVEQWFDDHGQRTKMHDPTGVTGTRTWTMAPNGADRAIGYAQSLTTGGTITTDLEWDPNGQRHQETLHVPTSTAPYTASYTATYGYDAAGQLTSRTGAGPDLTYDYDPRGNRLTQHAGDTGSVVTTNYTTNDDSELVTADPSSSDPTLTYGYDGDGNRITVTDGTDTDTTTYDTRGLPTTISRHRGPDTTTGRTYDGDGHLTRAQFDDLDYDLVWDPTQPVPQILEAYVDTDIWARIISGNERVGYSVAIDQGDPNGVIDGGAGLYGYNYDGSVIPTDTTITTAYAYDPYGQPVSPPTAPFWFGYHAEAQLDGLVHLRNRDYDPTTGTFTTPDPIDGTPGTTTQANPYDYTDNNPINRTDPLGLFSMLSEDAVDGVWNGFWSTWGAAAGAYGGFIAGGGGAAVAGGTGLVVCFESIVCGGAVIVGGIAGWIIGGALGQALVDYRGNGIQLNLPNVGSRSAGTATTAAGATTSTGTTTTSPPPPPITADDPGCDAPQTQDECDGDTWVIGESWEGRTQWAARAFKARAWDGPPRGSSHLQTCAANESWLRGIMAKGAKIIDIGIDRSRQGNRSPYYELEQRIITETGYSVEERFWFSSARPYPGVRVGACP